MLEAAGDTEGAKAARRKLREQRKAYREYSNEHGLSVHNDRLTVVKVKNGDDSYKNIYSSGLTKSGGSDIIKLEDIQIGKSLSAKAKNYDILDLQTGEHFKLVEGTRLQNVEVFAGKGTKTIFRDAEKYAKRYGGNSEDWQHVKGNGIVDYHEEERQAELHWVQCEGVGKYEFFVKEWLE